MSPKASDYTHTRNPRSIYLATLARPFPEWAEHSPVPTSEQFVKKASQAFADPARRLLPITDKATTFFSAIDCLANVGSYSDDTWERVKSACAHFGISADVAPYAELFADQVEKKASAVPAAKPGRFAIDEEFNGRRIRVLPLNDSEQVRDSASALVKMASENRIHYIQLVAASEEIVKAASDLGTKIPDFIHSCGEERLPDWEKAARLIESRNGCAGVTKEAMADYRDTVRSGAAGEISPVECMQKIAGSDSAAGIKYRYTANTHIPLPHDIVFGGASVASLEKAASEQVLIRDNLVPLSAFKKIPDADFVYRMPDADAGRRMRDLIKSASDASDVSLAVAELARPDQVTLFKLAAEYD